LLNAVLSADDLDGDPGDARPRRRRDGHSVSARCSRSRLGRADHPGGPRLPDHRGRGQCSSRAQRTPRCRLCAWSRTDLGIPRSMEICGPHERQSPEEVGPPPRTFAACRATSLRQPRGAGCGYVPRTAQFAQFAHAINPGTQAVHPQQWAPVTSS
jgi:hypothetical protein